MENCLINPSGNKVGFMACDYLCEYVVREVKRMMHHNVNDKTSKFLREVIGSQLMLFRNIRKKMAEETDAPTYGFHSSAVKTMKEVEIVADKLLQDNLMTFEAGRGKEEGTEEETQMVDLHGGGLKELGATKRIEKYIAKVEADHGLADKQWIDEDVEVDEDQDGPLQQEFDDPGDEWLEG